MVRCRSVSEIAAAPAEDARRLPDIKCVYAEKIASGNPISEYLCAGCAPTHYYFLFLFSYSSIHKAWAVSFWALPVNLQWILNYNFINLVLMFRAIGRKELERSKKIRAGNIEGPVSLFLGNSSFQETHAPTHTWNQILHKRNYYERKKRGSPNTDKIKLK